MKERKLSQRLRDWQFTIQTSPVFQELMAATETHADLAFRDETGPAVNSAYVRMAKAIHRLSEIGIPKGGWNWLSRQCLGGAELANERVRSRARVAARMLLACAPESSCVEAQFSQVMLKEISEFPNEVQQEIFRVQSGAKNSRHLPDGWVPSELKNGELQALMIAITRELKISRDREPKAS
jgi:hypothetical protein